MRGGASVQLTSFIFFLDFQKDSKQSKQIFDEAEKLFQVESLSQSAQNIVFASTTMTELVKEKERLTDARRKRQMDQTSIERSSEFVRELENLRNSFKENKAIDSHVNGRRNKIDPISKQPIRFPVKNKRCNHIYDKRSILEAIKINNNLR